MLGVPFGRTSVVLPTTQVIATQARSNRVPFGRTPSVPYGRALTGWVYVIDQRTRTPQGRIPPEDIIGAFAVQRGQVVPASYQRCPQHLILSADGFFQLGAELQACLLDELASLPETPDQALRIVGA